MATVSIQHLTKSFSGPTPAVRDFSLEIADREFVSLVGPSGCGKSTILRMIAGLEPVSSGEISIAGKPVNHLPPGDRDIAMVFQSFALFPHLTAFDNIAFGLRFRKFPAAEIKKRVLDAAAILGLAQHLDRKSRALSGGERQRVALGRAIVQQPKLFLFDEPLSSLDAAMRNSLRAEIIKLHHSLQATMLYVTHDQAEAMTMGDRIVVMKEGAIQQTAAPLALYRSPDNLFVAGFLGNPPMNFLHGKLRDSSAGLVFKETGDGVIELKLGDRPEARPFAGRDIIAGVRPEAIRLFPAAARNPARFQSLVDFIEQMGAETHVHLQTGAHSIVSRSPIPISSDEAGHRMQFEIDPASVHLFDPETSRRIAATTA